ncbi:MAG: NAD-dependent epimerase/dehydratase family protein [Verrucomicrobiota bacterium]
MTSYDPFGVWRYSSPIHRELTVGLLDYTCASDGAVPTDNKKSPGRVLGEGTNPASPHVQSSSRSKLELALNTFDLYHRFCLNPPVSTQPPSEEQDSSPANDEQRSDSKPTLLLTGSTGYLGSAFLGKALEHYEVRCLVRSRAGQNIEARSQPSSRHGKRSKCSIGGNADDLREAASDAPSALVEKGSLKQNPHEDPQSSPYFFKCDLTIDPIPPEAIEGVDIIVHLAGKAHALEERPGSEEESYRAITVDGTRKLLEAAKTAAVCRFVFASTVKVYPENPEGILDENSPTGPETPYGKTKLEAEELVLKGSFIPEPVVLRFSMIHGGRETGNMEKMEEAIRRNRFPPIPEFGNKRSMVHIDDATQALVLASSHKKAPGEIFIVTDGNPISTRELYVEILNKIERQPPRWTVPIWMLKSMARIGDTIGRLRSRRFIFDSDALQKLAGNAAFSSEKIQQQLGFKPSGGFAAKQPNSGG